MSDALFARFGRDFEAGEVLFREGDPGDTMFVIQSGTVRISKRVGVREKTLAVLGMGEFVGEMAILNGKARTATATVVTPAKCLTISAKTLESMVAKNAEIAMRLIKKLAKRLDAADALVEILMHQDPRARVILGLSRNADASGERIPDGGIRLSITPEGLADEVGVDRSVVEDVLTKLMRLRLITREPDGTLGLAEVDRLHDFLEFLEMPGASSPHAPRGRDGGA